MKVRLVREREQRSHAADERPSLHGLESVRDQVVNQGDRPGIPQVQKMPGVIERETVKFHCPAQPARPGLRLQDGDRAGVEMVGGTWMLLVSWAALRAGVFPKGLNYLGLVIGLAGLTTLVPALEMMAIIFGLGQIVWFVWVGIVMLRSRPSIATEEREAMVPRHKTA